MSRSDGSEVGMVAGKAERESETATEDAKTWRDYLDSWMGEPRLITRAEVLEKVAQLSAEVSERTLRYWETAGVLPRPVRQKHQGVVQAVYPEWFPWLVVAAYVARQHGRTVPQLAEIMPQAVKNTAILPWIFDNRIMPLDETSPGAALIAPLSDLVRAFSEPDNPVRTVSIRLTDARGETVVNHLWSVPPNVLSDGPGGDAPSDSLLSDGGPASVPPDSR